MGSDMGLSSSKSGKLWNESMIENVRKTAPFDSRKVCVCERESNRFISK